MPLSSQLVSELRKSINRIQNIARRIIRGRVDMYRLSIAIRASEKAAKRKMAELENVLPVLQSAKELIEAHSNNLKLAMESCESVRKRVHDIKQEITTTRSGVEALKNAAKSLPRVLKVMTKEITEFKVTTATIALRFMGRRNGKSCRADANMDKETQSFCMALEMVYTSIKRDEMMMGFAMYFADRVIPTFRSETDKILERLHTIQVKIEAISQCIAEIDELEKAILLSTQHISSTHDSKSDHS